MHAIEQKKCNNLLHEYLESANEQGHSFKEDFAKQPVVEELMRVLEFFNDHKLLPDSQTQLFDF